MEAVHKKLFLGVDEAGYGPNLGPLVVAASLWSAPGDFSEERFAAAFDTAFQPRPYAASCTHVPLGDSKKLYSSQLGLASLEAGLLALFGTLEANCDNLGQFVQRVAIAASIDELQALQWYAGYPQRTVPGVLDDRSEIPRLTGLATAGLAPLGIQLLDLRAAIVCEPRFNQAVAACGSKGELLSRTTLELVASLLGQCSTETEVYCDRHGGRKNYLPHLLAAMPDEWFSETASSAARSSYRSQGERPLAFHFSVGGDGFPPTALASMLAKYLRERLMEVLNSYWREHLGNLRPTAGYPTDARRFRKTIEPIAKRLQLCDSLWWRCK